MPCQVYVYDNGDVKLLFQATVAANSEAVYTVKHGGREEFETKAYSRYVPEREDDYAYENNLIAGRVYGPALEFPRTLGCDVWLKCTERLILDEWYVKMDYHHNYGDGMDCYKVAGTLGGGAIAPVSADGHIVLGDNYAEWNHLTDGPIRTEAVLEYNAFDVDGQAVSATRIVSLDANSRFVKSVTTFHADQPVQACIAAIAHDVCGKASAANWIAFTEPASDTDDPVRDGNISIAVVLENAEGNVEAEIDGHYALVLPEGTSGAITGWLGSGWSQGGVESQEAWEAEVAHFAACVASPLEVSCKGKIK